MSKGKKFKALEHHVICFNERPVIEEGNSPERGVYRRVVPSEFPHNPTFYEKYESRKWGDVVAEIEVGFPDTRNLAALLRSDSEPPPLTVRLFLADLIEGKIKRAKGRPDNAKRDREIVKYFDALVSLKLAQKTAMDETAKKFGLSRHSVDVIINPRNLRKK